MSEGWKIVLSGTGVILFVLFLVWNLVNALHSGTETWQRWVSGVIAAIQIFVIMAAIAHAIDSGTCSDTSALLPPCTQEVGHG